MKLTTKQLRQIIKEELNFILETNEAPAYVEEEGLSPEEIEKVENMLYNQDDLELILQGLSVAEVFPQISVDYQKILINKTEEQLKDMVKNPAVSKMSELLHHIATVAHHYTTLILIAKNPSASPKTLEMLGSLEGVNYNNIVVHVAGNPSTPIEMLLKLSKHKAAYVRRAVARRDDVPSDRDWETTILL